MSLHEPGDGEIVLRTDDGLLIERKQCSLCGESIERKPLDRWHPAGHLVSGNELTIVEVR